MKLTAVFETWHISDGNYPPLRRGQQVNLSFEIYPNEVDGADSNRDDSLEHLGGGQYEFTGSILRTYSEVTVVRCGGFRFYINRAIGLNEGDQVRGSGALLLDHYLWVEFLDQYRNPPDLFYQLLVERISRVRIPGSFVVRQEHGQALPTSLAPVDDRPEQITEVETMQGQAFDDEFYLLDLTDKGISGNVPHTFRTLAI